MEFFNELKRRGGLGRSMFLYVELMKSRALKVLVSPDLTGQSHAGPLRFIGEERSNWIVKLAALN